MVFISPKLIASVRTEKNVCGVIHGEETMESENAFLYDISVACWLRHIVDQTGRSVNEGMKEHSINFKTKASGWEPVRHSRDCDSSFPVWEEFLVLLVKVDLKSS